MILIKCDYQVAVCDLVILLFCLSRSIPNVIDWFLKQQHRMMWLNQYSGPLFTKRTDVLMEDLAKSRSRDVACCHGRIALKFGRHLGSAAAGVKFGSDWKSLIWISRLQDFTRSYGKIPVCFVNRSPDFVFQPIGPKSTPNCLGLLLTQIS